MAKKKILVIDDEVSITKLMKFVLEKTGLYEVECENSGLNAFARIKSVRPDALILDINMPEVNGGEIASAVKEDAMLSKTPIVFLTGDISNDEADGGLKIGGYPAMAKPINMEKLLSCIQKTLAG